MIPCKTCGEDTVLKVAEKNGIDMYSCCNEDCDDYAELLVMTNQGTESMHNMLNTFKNVVKDITDEKDKNTSS